MFQAEEFVFCFVVGAIASAPASFASMAALATRGVVFRTSVTVVLSVALAGGVYWAVTRTLESVFGLRPPYRHEFDALFGYYLLFALSVLGFLLLRLVRSWRFEMARSVAGECRDGVRYSVGSLLGVTTAVAVFAGGVVLLSERRYDGFEFLVAYAMLFATGGVLTHWVCARSSSQRIGAIPRVLVSIAVSGGFLMASKFAISDNLPNGPGVGFANTDLLGPCTVGFSLGALGVQWLYLSIVYACGGRLTVD